VSSDAILRRDLPYAAVNGLNMYYEVHGEGPPLLLLHGGSGSIPEKWIPFFSPRFQVIAMEHMGHGRTADLGDRPFHYHDMAEDTVELMRQLKVESAVVVGYSDGGIIGLDIAIHHPEIVLGRLQPMWIAEPSFTPGQLQSIAAPTLIIIGDADIVTPEHAVEMFRAIPGAQLCVVPGAGHGILPKETVLALLQEDAKDDG
jgi:pimeloyl-ACP methyl ester carboxylesterase